MLFFFLMLRRPPRSTQSRSSAASDVYKRQVLYHALNGVRIILIDFWAKGPKYQKSMLRSIIVVWLVVMIPGAYFMLLRTFQTLFGASS